MTVEYGGTVERRRPFGDGLEALEIRLTTELSPGEVASLRYITRFHEGEATTEFRRFAHGRTDNVDIKVTFDAQRLPQRIWWMVWDDYLSGGPVVEAVVVDAKQSVHRFLSHLEQAAVGFRWRW